MEMKLSNRCATVIMIAFAVVPLAAQIEVPVVDRSGPPAVAASTDGFAIRRLSAPVTIDGTQWIAVNPIWGGIGTAPDSRFTVSLADENEEGDAARYRITYAEGGGKPVSLNSEVVAYALVTPDSRWIVFEPVEVVDVRAWRRYNLSEQFGIGPYVSPKAVSADGKRLVFSRNDCLVDCRDFPDEYYEIRFPDPAPDVGPAAEGA